MRDRDRSHLHPLMVPLLHKHQMLAAADPACGVTTLFETYRPPGQQALDWLKGRNSAGEVVNAREVVTHARPGDSWHQTQRWVRLCPDCKHEMTLHQGAGAVLACSAGGPNLGESCPCAVTSTRLETAPWEQVPAALAYHLALLCQGCHPSGTLVGMGAHGKLTPEDMRRIEVLGKHGQSLSLRWLGDADSDGHAFEKGEWDLYHFELRPGTLGTVKAVLSIRGGRLEEGLHA